MAYRHAVVCVADAVQALAWEFALVQENYVAHLVADYAQAISLISEKRPDIVIVQAGIGGGDLRGLLRAAPPAPGKPFTIVLSEDAAPAAEWRRLGADEIAPKPYKLDEIRACVAALAGRLAPRPRCDPGQSRGVVLPKWTLPPSVPALRRPQDLRRI